MQHLDQLEKMKKYPIGFYGTYFEKEFYFRYMYYFKKEKVDLDELFELYKYYCGVLDREDFLNVVNEENIDEYVFMLSKK